MCYIITLKLYKWYGLDILIQQDIFNIKYLIKENNNKTIIRFLGIFLNCLILFIDYNNNNFFFLNIFIIY